MGKVAASKKEALDWVGVSVRRGAEASVYSVSPCYLPFI